MGNAFLTEQLSHQTPIFNLKLWVVLCICIGATIIIILFLISLYIITSITKRHTTTPAATNPNKIPNISREIQEIKIITNESNTAVVVKDKQFNDDEDFRVQSERIHIEIGKENRITYPEKIVSRDEICAFSVAPEVSHLGWGHWYSLKELEAATNEFADENVIGEGGYGIVYRGVFIDNNTIVAVKNLLNNRSIQCQSCTFVVESE